MFESFKESPERSYYRLRAATQSAGGKAVQENSLAHRFLHSLDWMPTLELTWELISVTRSDSRVAAAGVGSRLEARVAC